MLIINKSHRTPQSKLNRHMPGLGILGCPNSGNVRYAEWNLLSTSEIRAFQNAQSTFSAPAGGVLVNEGFLQGYEMALQDGDSVRRVATVERVEKHGLFKMPMVDDTNNTAIIATENADYADQDQGPNWAAINFNLRNYYSRPQYVSEELFRDSAVDLGQRFGEILGYRIKRLQNEHFTTGDGVGKPMGLLNHSTLGVTTASSATFTSDEVLSLKYSLDAAYIPGSRWMMHPNIRLTIANLKDGNGHPIFKDNLLDGDEVVLNGNMPSSITAGSKPILYGRFDKYRIVDYSPIRVVFFMETRVELGQIGVGVYAPSDGAVIDAGTNPIKYLQTASS